MNLIKEISNLPEICIYGLINNIDNKIFIGYTSDLVTALNRNIKDIKYSNHPCKKDLDKLDLLILEKLTNNSNIRSRYMYWCKDYRDKGFKLYRSFKSIEYKVRTDIHLDFREKKTSKVLFYVKLVTRGYKKIVVGVFDNIKDRDMFIKKYYSSDIFDVIYSTNDITNRFREVYG